jgi:hypothetical protein
VVDLDNPAVRRDIQNHDGLFVFLPNKFGNASSATANVIENMELLDAAGSVATGATTKLQFTRVDIPAGFTVTSLTWVATGTAAATSTASWATLHKVVGTNLVAVAVSANDASGNGGFAANTAKSFNVFSTGTTKAVTDNSEYYAGLVLVAGTMPTLAGATLASTALAAFASRTLNANEATAVRTTTPITVGAGPGTVAISDLAASTAHVPYVRVA